MDHLLEAKKQVTGDKYLSKNNILLSIALSAIAIAEELKTANSLTRIAIENMALEATIKQKDLPLWFKCGGGK